MSFKEIVKGVVQDLKYSQPFNMAFFLLWVFDFIGGTGSLFYDGHPQFAIANIVFMVVVFFIAYSGSEN